jgi:hypothetical protein
MRIGDLVLVQSGYDDYLREVGVVIHIHPVLNWVQASDNCADILGADGIWTVGISDLEVITSDGEPVPGA